MQQPQNTEEPKNQKPPPIIFDDAIPTVHCKKYLVVEQAYGKKPKSHNQKAKTSEHSVSFESRIQLVARVDETKQGYAI